MLLIHPTECLSPMIPLQVHDYQYSMLLIFTINIPAANTCYYNMLLIHLIVTYAPTPPTYAPPHLCPHPTFVPIPRTPPPLGVDGSDQQQQQGQGQSLDANKAALALSPPVTAVKKEITIKCVKGKTVKKVVGVKPVCPSGYKKAAA